MTQDTIIDITRSTLWLIIKVSAPLLITSLIIGLVISVIQTITSIQEQTLTFVPKLIAVFLVLALCGGWIMNSIAEFTTELFSNLNLYIQ